MPSLIGQALAGRPRNLSVPVPMGDGGFYKLPGLAMGGNQQESFMRAYGTVGTIFSIVSLYASSTARSPWKLFRQQPQDGRRRYTTRDEGSDQRVEVVQHQSINVLSRPGVIMNNGQPLTVRTRQNLFELSQMYLDLTGESYWIVERDPRSSIPLGLWPARPDRMEPVPDRDNYLKGYVYTSPTGDQRIPLQPDEVIFTCYPNPLDPYHGLGPVQSVLVDIDAAKYSAEWNRNYFINSATPGGVIQVDHQLDDDEWDNLVNRWREAHRGVSRAHRVAVLEAGQTWIPNAHTIKDMDFGGLRTVMRDVMREAFRMHKVMLGVSDDVNRANAQTGEEVFASWGIVPRLDRWRDVLNSQFLPLFGSTGNGVEWDYVTPIPPNREQDNQELTAKSQATYVLVQAGYDPHDVLEVVGLPDMKVAEKATQAPALPPGWVPEAPDGGDDSDSGMEPASAPGAPAMPAGDETAKALLRALTSTGPQRRDMALMNMTGGRE